MSNPHKRRDRDQDRIAQTALGRQTADKLNEATAAVRQVEADILTAFELVDDLEALALESGHTAGVAMSPEVGAAFRAYRDCPGVRRRAVADPLENIPAVIR